VRRVREYIFIFQTTFSSRHSILLNITPLRHLHCAAPHSVRHSIVITTLTADTSLCFMTLQCSHSIALQYIKVRVRHSICYITLHCRHSSVLHYSPLQTPIVPHYTPLATIRFVTLYSPQTHHCVPLLQSIADAPMCYTTLHCKLSIVLHCTPLQTLHCVTLYSVADTRLCYTTLRCRQSKLSQDARIAAENSVRNYTSLHSTNRNYALLNRTQSDITQCYLIQSETAHCYSNTEHC
jgi:hypothetical protein